MKLAIYYNHYNTLGHSTRVLGLVKAVRRSIPGVKILVLEGGRTPDILPLRRYARVHVIPHSMDKKGLFIEEDRRLYTQMISGAAIDRMLQERQAMMRGVLSKFRPDIFMTEYFPLGQEFWTFELPPLLAYVRQEFACRIVSSCGYLSYTEKAYQHIRDFYDAVFVHSPRPFALEHVNYFSADMALGLRSILRDFRDRIHFTGFVADIPAEKAGVRMCGRGVRQGRFEKLVFVSRGGGVVNKEILVASIMAARRKPEWFFKICCGPATHARDVASCQRLARGMKNVDVVKSLAVPVFDRYLAAADLNVSMSGYNTAVKLMRWRKRVVFVPYASTEQCYRAALLKAYLPAVCLQDKDVTVARLSAAMDQALALPMPQRRIPAGWFDGADQTARMLACV